MVALLEHIINITGLTSSSPSQYASAIVPAAVHAMAPCLRIPCRGGGWGYPAADI